ncbi:MAG: cupin domain-containing protein [Caulobacterales bacterium]|nr:cupin domain-containing protein [Caulobacterales bacterium]
MMQTTRIASASPYEAAKHFGMTAMRLQGQGVTSCDDFWVGLSTFAPGGGAEWSEGGGGKVYVVLEGRMTVVTKSGEVELGPMDSCYLAAGEGRSMENKHDEPSRLLVIASSGR